MLSKSAVTGDSENVTVTAMATRRLLVMALLTVGMSQRHHGAHLYCSSGSSIKQLLSLELLNLLQLLFPPLLPPTFLRQPRPWLAVCQSY